MASLVASFARLSVGASTSTFRGQAVAGTPVVAPVQARTSVVVMAAGPKKKPSVLKRQRTNETARLYNKARKSAIATRIKKVLVACQAQEPVETVEALISEATKAIDKATAKGIIHKNTAARRKSRMARAKHAMVATLQ